MKAEKRSVGVFRRLLSLLTHNWGLKILSLVLALIVYHTMKPGTDFSHESNERYIFQDKNK